jgi:hypothetical protein
MQDPKINDRLSRYEQTLLSIKGRAADEHPVASATGGASPWLLDCRQTAMNSHFTALNDASMYLFRAQRANEASGGCQWNSKRVASALSDDGRYSCELLLGLHT